jgi:hypothetical protein
VRHSTGHARLAHRWRTETSDWSSLWAGTVGRTAAVLVSVGRWREISAGRVVVVGSLRRAGRRAGVHGCGCGGGVSRHHEAGGHGRDGDFDVVLLRLGGEGALCLVAVALALAVLFESVLHRDLLVHQELAVHIRDRVVRGVKGRVRDEAVAFAEIGLVAGDFGRRDQRAEARKGLEQHFLLHHGVQVADEQLCSHAGAASQPARALGASVASVGAGLVHSDWFSPDADLVHDLDGIVGVLLGAELDEAVALVGLCDAVFGQVDVDDGAGLQHQLPDLGICGLLGEVADVEGAVLVLFPAVARVSCLRLVLRVCGRMEISYQCLAPDMFATALSYRLKRLDVLRLWLLRMRSRSQSKCRSAKLLKLRAAATKFKVVSRTTSKPPTKREPHHITTDYYNSRTLAIQNQQHLTPHTSHILHNGLVAVFRGDQGTP